MRSRRALLVLMGRPFFNVGIRVGECGGIMLHWPTTATPSAVTNGPSLSFAIMGR